MTTKFGVFRKAALGFTLIEILVVIALMGGAALVVASLMQNVNRGQVILLQSLAFQDMVSEITQYLRDPNACKNTLFGLTIPTSSIPSGIAVPAGIKNNSTPPIPPAVVIPPGKVYGSAVAQVRIESFALMNSASTVIPNTKILTTTLRVRYLKKKPDGTWPPTSATMSRDINLSVQADSLSKVQSCASDADMMTETMCNSLGGTYDFTLNKCKDLHLTGTTTLTGPLCQGVNCSTVVPKTICFGKSVVVGISGGNVICADKW